MVNKKPKAKKLIATKTSKSKTKTPIKTTVTKSKKQITHTHLLAASVLAILASCAALAVSNLASAATTITKVTLPTNKINFTINPATCTNVGVYSCRQADDGIYTRCSNKTLEGFTANGCHDAGQGLHNYSLSCVNTTTYQACYTQCGATTSTTSTIALSRLSFFNAPSPTTTARGSKAWVGRFKVFTFNQDAIAKNFNFMATGTISGTQYYLYQGNNLIATNGSSDLYQISFDLNNYRLTKGVTTTFDIYLNTSQQTIGSFEYLFLNKNGISARDAVTNENITEISGVPMNIGPVYVAR